MKKAIIIISLLMTVMIVMAGCGSQEQASTASSRLTEGDNTAMATVDLSGGWSVEFASGAIYMYEGPNDGKTDCTAMAVTLEKEVYDEYSENNKDNETYAENDGVISYTDPDNGETNFLFETEKGMHIMLAVNEGTDADAVLAKLTLVDE